MNGEKQIFYFSYIEGREFPMVYHTSIEDAKERSESSKLSCYGKVIDFNGIKFS